MKRNFDKILLGLLWLMMVALATTFWMNTQYGFNIFSAAHWEYLSGLQADRASIKPEFYISLVFAIFIALIGLYAIVRPRFRKIPMPDSKPANPAPSVVASVPQPTYNNASYVPQRPRSPSSFSNIVKKPTPRQQTPQQQNFTPPTKPMNVSMPTPQKLQANPLSQEINHAFESADYLMKPCQHIGKLNNPVLALGYNQTLWIATSNDSYENMIDAFQTLVTVFEDTLGDSANDITLRGCIISPTSTSDHEMISSFADIEQFKQFVANHKNTQSDDFDKELFEAVSTYVSTVATYIGKS